MFPLPWFLRQCTSNFFLCKRPRWFSVSKKCVRHEAPPVNSWGIIHTVKCWAEQGLRGISPPCTKSILNETWGLSLGLQWFKILFLLDSILSPPWKTLVAFQKGEELQTTQLRVSCSACAGGRGLLQPGKTPPTAHAGKGKRGSAGCATG